MDLQEYVNCLDGARFGVYVAYVYFHELLLKIRRVKAEKLLHERIRVTNNRKYVLLLNAYFRNLTKQDISMIKFIVFSVFFD